MPGAEIDHFFHRGLNRPEHGWLVCAACHGELTHGGYLARFLRMPEFRAFQAAVLEQRRRERAAPDDQARQSPQPSPAEGTREPHDLTPRSWGFSRLGPHHIALVATAAVVCSHSSTAPWPPTSRSIHCMECNLGEHLVHDSTCPL